MKEVTLGNEDVTSATPPTISDDGGAAFSPETLPDVYKNDDGTVNLEALYEAARKGEAPEESAEGTELELETPEEGAKEEAPTEETPAADGNRFTPENMDRWHKQITEAGEVSDALVEEIGVPKELIETFMASQQAAAASGDHAAFQAIGGAEEFKAIQEWSQGSLSETERTAVNKILKEGTTETIALTLQGLQARMKREAAPARRVGGGSGGGNQSNVYSSQAEMKRDIADPRYRTDPAFRDQVMRKARGLT